VCKKNLFQHDLLCNFVRQPCQSIFVSWCVIFSFLVGVLAVGLFHLSKILLIDFFLFYCYPLFSNEFSSSILIPLSIDFRHSALSYLFLFFISKYSLFLFFAFISDGLIILFAIVFTFALGRIGLRTLNS
jgi:hypothetical protein